MKRYLHHRTWRSQARPLALVAVAALILGGVAACTNDQEASAGGSAAGGRPAGVRSGESVEQWTAGWPQASKKAAADMVQKYGRPDSVTSDRLIWQDKGTWKEIILSKEEVPHSFPMQHTDVLEQVIEYRVPPDKFDELAEYDGSVIVERTKGTLSARCDKEPMNYLALNLAHDIVTGKRSVEDARQFYAQTAMAFMKGEKHPYTQKLQFELPGGNTADPDRPAGQ